MRPAAPRYVFVTVSNKSPISLNLHLLTENSEYFRTMFSGSFAENQSGEVKIQWDGDKDNCLLFLTWIGTDCNVESNVLPECRIKFLQCCTYFKVKERFLNITLQGIDLAQTYSGLNKEMKSAWNRTNVPFHLMCEMTEKVTNKYEQIVYACAWMDGIPTSTKLEQQTVMQGNDFMHLREFLVQKMQKIEEPLRQQYPGLFPTNPKNMQGQMGGMPQGQPGFQPAGPPAFGHQGGMPYQGMSVLSGLPQNAQACGISNSRELIEALRKFPISVNAFNLTEFWDIAIAEMKIQGSLAY